MLKDYIFSMLIAVAALSATLGPRSVDGLAETLDRGFILK